ncbi:hypothetical protein [uncultured Cytophaga sp.]|uniref:hypothetical protein n=1 Tax=uncultured Cytophaga sp. TaxID=160238 RepID=UPI00260A3B5A|nr:hypothetical protein [uncultured Cytophaga sp.]
MKLTLLPVFIFLLVFQSQAQKYQLRPVIVQVLPFGLDMTSKFLSNENGLTNSSQVTNYLKDRGGRYQTTSLGFNLNVSVYVPVSKKLFIGANYNSTSTKSSLYKNTINHEFNERLKTGPDSYEDVEYISNYERKITTMGLGIMYLAENPMRGLPFIPFFKFDLNLMKVQFSDIDVVKDIESVDTNSNIITEDRENINTAISNVNTVAFNIAVGLNMKINSNIQYTLFEARLAQYKMGIDNTTQFSLKTGVTILIGRRK